MAKEAIAYPSWSDDVVWDVLKFIVSQYRSERPDLVDYRSWSDVPSDVLNLILSHLSERDHVVFGLVCKTWRFVSCTPYNSFPLEIDFSKVKSPLLMAPAPASASASALKGEGGGGERYNLYSPANYSFYLHIPKLLSSSDSGQSTSMILACRYGWLLVGECRSRSSSNDGIAGEEENCTIFFFHPMTKQRIDLPDLPSNDVSVFSFHGLPTSPECTVVAIDNFGVVHLEIFILKSGLGHDWNEKYLYYEEDQRFSDDRHFICCNPVFHKGKCYCLDRNGRVAAFDVDNVEDSWNFCGEAYSKMDHHLCVAQSFIVVVSDEGDDVLVVFLGHESQIWICKFNLITMEWEDVDDLGPNKVLYLSNGASWLATTDFHGMGNRIYLPMLSDDATNTAIFYSLTTRRFHSNVHDWSRKNFYHMKQLYNCAWIEP